MDRRSFYELSQRVLEEGYGGHAGDSGLQNWSVGDIYPYMIVTVSKNGKNFDQPMHAITGWKGGLYPWGEDGDNRESSALAHQEIEQHKAQSQTVPGI